MDLETSDSTQMYITNNTTKICVTSVICVALFAVDVSNTKTCNSPSTNRCPLSAGEMAYKFLRDRQDAVNYREIFCRFSCPWGFKPNLAGMCL